MSRECKLKPGMDTVDFVNRFNEMNFDIMCALEAMEPDGEKVLFGLVFFERTQKETKKLSLFGRFKKWLLKVKKQ